MNRQADLALMDSVWSRIRDHLENERHRIYQEIKNYPTPIPACDAQFNYLLEERANIVQEFDRLKALSNDSLSRRDHIKCIDEFIVLSNYITGKMEQTIRSSLLGVSDASG